MDVLLKRIFVVKTMSNNTTITIPINLRKKARKYGLNISELTRKILTDEVSKKEKEVTGTRRAIPVAGNTLPKEGDQIVSIGH